MKLLSQEHDYIFGGMRVDIGARLRGRDTKGRPQVGLLYKLTNGDGGTTKGFHPTRIIVNIDILHFIKNSVYSFLEN